MSRAKDPRHVGVGQCERCGIAIAPGTFCPVGFWADPKQLEGLAMFGWSSPSDEEYRRELRRLETNEINRWSLDTFGDLSCPDSAIYTKEAKDG